jgi:hypothetical protein
MTSRRGRPRIAPGGTTVRIQARPPAGLVAAIDAAAIGYERRPDTIRRLLDVGLAEAALHGLAGLDLQPYDGEPVAVEISTSAEVVEQVDALCAALAGQLSRSGAVVLLLAAGVEAQPSTSATS